MSSPEQLNDYIKVTNPGVWMVLEAIVILLVGVCVWGVFGKLETKLSVAAVSGDGQTLLYVKEKNAACQNSRYYLRTAALSTRQGSQSTERDALASFIIKLKKFC